MAALSTKNQIHRTGAIRQHFSNKTPNRKGKEGAQQSWIKTSLSQSVCEGRSSGGEERVGSGWWVVVGRGGGGRGKGRGGRGVVVCAVVVWLGVYVCVGEGGGGGEERRGGGGRRRERGGGREGGRVVVGVVGVGRRGGGKGEGVEGGGGGAGRRGGMQVVVAAFWTRGCNVFCFATRPACPTVTFASFLAITSHLALSQASDSISTAASKSGVQARSSPLYP